MEKSATTELAEIINTAAISRHGDGAQDGALSKNGILYCRNLVN